MREARGHIPGDFFNSIDQIFAMWYNSQGVCASEFLVRVPENEVTIPAIIIPHWASHGGAIGVPTRVCPCPITEPHSPKTVDTVDD